MGACLLLSHCVVVDEEVFRDQPYFRVGIEVGHLLHLGRDDSVVDNLDEVPYDGAEPPVDVPNHELTKGKMREMGKRGRKPKQKTQLTHLDTNRI